MSRMLIPRLCRQVQAVQCPIRMMSSRRNLPVFWWGRRRPFDDFLTTNSVFDSHMKDAIDHFRMLERLSDPIARAENRAGEFLTQSAGAEVCTLWQSCCIHDCPRVNYKTCTSHFLIYITSLLS